MGCIVGNNEPDPKYSWGEITAFADYYWHYTDEVDSQGNILDFNYWIWLDSKYGLSNQGIGPTDDEDITNYFYNNFLHIIFLPSEKNQQYYKGIGNYDQFIYGWEDIDDKEDGEYINPGIRDKNGEINFDMNIYEIKSPLRDKYLEMYYAEK